MKELELTTKADKRISKKQTVLNKWIKHWIGKHKNHFIHMSKKKKRKK